MFGFCFSSLFRGSEQSDDMFGLPVTDRFKVFSKALVLDIGTTGVVVRLQENWILDIGILDLKNVVLADAMH